MFNLIYHKKQLISYKPYEINLDLHLHKKLIDFFIIQLLGTVFYL